MPPDVGTPNCLMFQSSEGNSKPLAEVIPPDKLAKDLYRSMLVVNGNR